MNETLVQKRYKEAIQKAFKPQSDSKDFEYCQGSFFVYDVKAGNNIETRACKSLKIIIDNYDFVHKHRNKVLLSVKDKTTFPHIEEERTHYSLELPLMQTFKTDGYDHISQYLDYIFWDTSTDFMVRFGVPTKTDVEFWIVAIKENKNLTKDQQEELISICDDYNE